MSPGLIHLRPELGRPLGDAIAEIERLEPEDAFDERIPRALVAAGLHLMPVPVSSGGLGASMAESAQVLAALGAVDGSIALGFAMHLHVVSAIADSVTWPATTRERLFRSIVGDGALVNSAATEEGGGSPARGAVPGTIATPDPTGDGWRLTGEKTWTTWLPALRFAIVSARLTDVEQVALSTNGPRQSVGSFLVDLTGPGIERRAGFEALGMRGSASGRLVLEDAHVPGGALVNRRLTTDADPGRTASRAWFAMAVAATYLGVGEGARARVARWALDRRPGDGSTAVADLPTVQLRLGHLDAALRVARIVLVDATGRWDAAAGDEGARATTAADLALAKVTATNAAVTATDEALRIAGGPGFLAGRLERAFRDARAGLINPPLDDIALTGFGQAVLEASK